MRQEIQNIFDRFIRAWEGQDAETVKACLHPLPFAYVSMYGHAYDPDTISRWFSQPGLSGSNLTVRKLQSTIHVQEKEAVQYAAILGLLQKEESHLAFGGTFIIRYVQAGADWKMETIRFQLQSDDATLEETLDAEGIVHRTPGTGDITLLGDWLKVDDRVGAFQDKISGSGETVITPELDGPWQQIQQPQAMNDEQLLQDTLCRLSLGFDFLAMMTAIPAIHEEASLETKLYGILPKRTALIYAKELRKAMPRSFTGLQVENLVHEGDRIQAELKHLSPAAFAGNGVRDTYEATFCKENGQWLLSKLSRRAGHAE